MVRPVKVPGWLEHALGLIPYVYLGAAVLFAATGSAFVICQYDPFVSFFRLGGSQRMSLAAIPLQAGRQATPEVQAAYREESMPLAMRVGVRAVKSSAMAARPGVS